MPSGVVAKRCREHWAILFVAAKRTTMRYLQSLLDKASARCSLSGRPVSLSGNCYGVASRFFALVQHLITATIDSYRCVSIIEREVVR